VWKRLQKGAETKMERYIIVIDRQYGSGGREIGEKLAKGLGINFYDQNLIMLSAKESGFDESLFKKTDEHRQSPWSYTLSMYGSSRMYYDLSLNDQLYLIQSKVIKQIAKKESCIIMGRCADFILKDSVPTINFFVHAPIEDRVLRATEVYKDDPSKVKETIKHIDKNRATYYNYYTDSKWGSKDNYDLIINSSSIGIDATVKVLKTFIIQKLD